MKYNKRMKRIAITVLFFAFLFVGTAQAITITPDSYDFGTIPVEQLRDHQFNVSLGETGSGNITATLSGSSEFTCIAGCGQAYNLNSSNPSFPVIIRFQPNSVGSFSATLSGSGFASATMVGGGYNPTAPGTGGGTTGGNTQQPANGGNTPPGGGGVTTVDDCEQPAGGGVRICNPLKVNSFEQLIDKIIDFIFNIALVIAPLVIMYAGFILVTQGENAQEVNRARNIILWTVVGIVIIIISKGLVNILTGEFLQGT
jgi:hypothetical protein